MKKRTSSFPINNYYIHQNIIKNLNSIQGILLCFFGLLFLLFSCAQVGEISGGSKDQFAPKPIQEKTFPPNGSLNFNSKQITIQFDEFIKLNNPNENIIIVPRGIKINPKIDKKKLTLDLEGEFEKNTTYQITLNSAIKDITEGNDSLMHYFFATGNEIDSLKYGGTIADAYSGEKLKNIFVGLYAISDSIDKTNPIYFTKTDLEGNFKIPYLKEGTYQVYAFNDINKDMLFQITEKAGFRDSLLVLNQSIKDSNAILISQNPLTKKIINKSYTYPRLVNLSANYSLEKTHFVYNNQNIENTSIFYHSTDSISILLLEKPISDFSIVASNDDKKDTLTFKVLQNPKNSLFYTINPSDKDISKEKTFTFLFADEIISIDKNLISCFDLDSNAFSTSINYEKNRLIFKIPDSISKNITVDFMSNSLVFSEQSINEKISCNFSNKSEQQFGSLIFKSITLPKNSFVEFILNGKVVRKLSELSLKNNPTVSKLDAGEYSFRIILDENQNLKWDGGSILEKKQAEKVLHFPEKAKVRANWETEIEFELNSNGGK